MAEIATEDPAPVEEEEESAAAKEGTQGEDEDQEEGETSSQSQEERVITAALQDDSDTDSDTDDENDAEQSTSVVQSSALNQTLPHVSAVNPTLSASQTQSVPSTCSTTEGTNPVLGVTIAKAGEATASPVSPRRCISVSSPGRGQKIFMVTRVESPPEQQPVGLQEFKPKSPSQTAEENTVASSPLIAQTSQTSSRTECNPTTQSEPATSSQTLHQEVLGLTQTTTEQEPSTVSNTDIMPMNVQSPEDNSEIVKKLESVSTEHLNQHSSPTKATLSAENSTENKPDQDKHCSRKAAQDDPSFLQQQSEINGEVQGTINGCSLEPTTSDVAGDCEPHTDVQSPQITTSDHGNTPQMDKEVLMEQDLHIEQPQPASAKNFSSSSQLDQVESFTTQSTAGVALPNGLRPEFALHLLEPEVPKAACCVMEHSECKTNRDLINDYSSKVFNCNLF